MHPLLLIVYYKLINTKKLTEILIKLKEIKDVSFIQLQSQILDKLFLNQCTCVIKNINIFVLFYIYLYINVFQTQ